MFNESCKKSNINSAYSTVSARNLFIQNLCLSVKSVREKNNMRETTIQQMQLLFLLSLKLSLQDQ